MVADFVLIKRKREFDSPLDYKRYSAAVARRAHNPEVKGSIPFIATFIYIQQLYNINFIFKINQRR